MIKTKVFTGETDIEDLIGRFKIRGTYIATEDAADIVDEWYADMVSET